MFPWNIARTAEQVFSRWAMRRLFKFVLKKKLGHLILGDIDLKQLDVQLFEGTVKLNDLALNVDYLNEKLGAAASVIIKEGSIGSLLVKMPWKVKGFQVEVDELEIVFAPYLKKDSLSEEASSSFSYDSNNGIDNEIGKHKRGKPGIVTSKNSVKSGSTDVHEGVKTIAKMVRLFLTSFHVKVRRLIVAYEPGLDMNGMKSTHQKTLVLQISEVECGTCFSEDTNLNSGVGTENFLGISQLTNFVKFHGAVLELLQMDDVDNQSCSPHASCSNHALLPKSSMSNCTTPIATGKKGGFSGNLKLSIPCNNGTLDIHKVDANVYVDPVELRFQPSTIKWLVLSWETYKNLVRDGGTKSTDSVYLNAASRFHSSACFPALSGSDRSIFGHGSFVSALSLNGQESVSEALSGSHFIPDWVTDSICANDYNDASEELDLGASVEQFFECFDGIRNSQSALASSGMWNWTGSVFSALTAASSLATGSLSVTSEQQHVQTNLNATFAEISILLSFQDEDVERLYGPDQSEGMNAHFLHIGCKDISFVFQVRLREVGFEGTLKYIEIAEYFPTENNVEDHSFCASSSNNRSQTDLIQDLQADIMCALPVLSDENPDSDEFGVLISPDSPFGRAMKIKLFSTAGSVNCKFAVNSDSSDGSLVGPRAFYLRLPQFVLWMDLSLINVIMDLLKDIEKSIKMNSLKKECDSFVEKHESSIAGAGKGLQSGIAKLSTKEIWQVNISVPNARVVLCPLVEGGLSSSTYSSWEQFIVVDSSPPLTSAKVKAQVISMSDANLHKRYSKMASFSLHLNVGDLKVYLVSSVCQEDVMPDFPGVSRKKFCADRILSVSNEAGCLSKITMLWQEGFVSGPWIAEKAKSLATCAESQSKENLVIGDEFAISRNKKNLQDGTPQTREEIILSSSFLLHVNLFSLVVNLNSPQYFKLQCLLDKMIKTLAGVVSDGVDDGNRSVSQTSILVECESVEISIRPNLKNDIKSSLQNELPGPWQCLKLKIKKVNLLSVPNIGGSRDANFLWLAHEEGELWGSISLVPDHEFLLISCSNSTRKRGDGRGSNALSSKSAGSDVIYLQEPESYNTCTSITVRCTTFVAVGGRLDWLDVVTSFFVMPSPEHENNVDNENLCKENLRAPCDTSLFLEMIDIGLSYEPHLKTGSTSPYVKETGDSNVACLLAASSLSLCNKSSGNSDQNEHKIRVHDLGLLLCPAYDNLGGTYSVEYLHEMGYVKVAWEALIEADLRTNCKGCLLWELDCSNCHIHVETCHDTTNGLMHLAAQLQQLFAPDLEQSVLHLQNRWTNFQQARQRKDSSDNWASSDDSASSTSPSHASNMDTKGKLERPGLLHEICENAFLLGVDHTGQDDSYKSKICVSIDENLRGDSCHLNVEDPKVFSNSSFFDGSLPVSGFEDSQTSFLKSNSFPELIEGYCLSDLRPLSELTKGAQSSSGDRNLGKHSGWYGDSCINIVENHISEVSGEDDVCQYRQNVVASINSEMSELRNAVGRILLKNIDVSWRMYNGSDWHAYEKSSEFLGRDTSACLELSLSAMQLQYDFFPVDAMYASKVSVSIRDFNLYDRSKAAPWKLILGDYHSKEHPRESSSKAFKLDLEAVRPDPLTPLEEYRLRIAFLPILLHLHQSQLDFLINFFGEKSPSADLSSDNYKTSGGNVLSASKIDNYHEHTVGEALLPFFQVFDISPILLRVDYSPCRVDLAALGGGKYVELVNLVTWKGVELHLKHVHHSGVYGWGSVGETIIGEWLEDISQHQMHKVLRGIPTIRSMAAVGSGAAKLVSLPVESYRKDKRVIKGMQRGTIAFLQSVSLEAVGLGVHLAAGVHDILLQAEYIVTKVPAVSWPINNQPQPNVRFSQPKNAQEGIKQAYESFSNGLGKSASALIQTPLNKYQRGASAGSALSTAIQAVPAAALAPFSACASAAHCTLLGLRNSLDPEHKQESMEKYLGPTKPRNWD
ncbi:hypothetical protein K2173_002253 [Erythroxylum novogranatense]|uniref:Autophagy-related protein 2 n=1 Tax=Erythroxylum novogranatense TaxID=1862640 RepID=A0AAV8TAS0_9ROSI|nr:hypothetical protein K2173_002253 [Erythroxylum novogranatense]